MSIIIFIIVLAVLILSHELGHFLVAKLSRVKVLEFGIGFPPKIIGKKIGETLYSINWIPFGGFVKMLGEDEPEETEGEKERNLVNKPKIAQAFVIIAGVVANALLAWLLLSFGYMSGLPVSTSGLPSGAEIQNERMVVVAVAEKSPAQIAGISVGDTITEVSSGEEKSELSPSGVSAFTADHEGLSLRVSYKRGDTLEVVEITPEKGVFVEGKSAMGVGLDLIGDVKYSFLGSFVEGAKTTVYITKATAVGFYQIIVGAFKKEVNILASISGPVGIVGLVGDAAELGFVHLLIFTAIISINLVIINLIPFPALDGGRLLFLIIEAIKGSPINPKFSARLNFVGFALLLTLMVVITYSDIVKIFT